MATEFSLEQRDAIGRAFSAGNYANAYQTRALSRAWRDFLRENGAVHHECMAPAFILGFFGTYALSEMVGGDRRRYDIAYRSDVGHYVVNVARYTDDRSEEYAAELK